jgi:CRISPR-associated exonuclease Cas4
MMIDNEVLFTGTQVNYYIICPTKLWLFSYFVAMERDSDLVSLGKLLQEISFQDVKKDLILDQRIALDFIKKGNRLIVHEIKKSSRLEEAHIFQLLYYLYYLKYEKGIENVEGIIDYSSKRKVIKVELTEEKEKKIEKVLKEINEIISKPKPPLPVYKKYCRKCAYFEFCFGDT